VATVRRIVKQHRVFSCAASSAKCGDGCIWPHFEAARCGDNLLAGIAGTLAAETVGLNCALGAAVDAPYMQSWHAAWRGGT
jgi:hypothetical protein